eukprot:GILJ01010805.1.p1 GENE.GILJ01010805.1~~GILJ01010805.1.p1  ORF type:complete len:1439 (-),score=327.96 GILJ01010805.1:47-4363(-)
MNISAADMGSRSLRSFSKDIKGYSRLGSTSTAKVDSLARNYLPSEFGLAEIKTYLSMEKMLGRGMVDSVLIHAVAYEPTRWLADAEAVKNWLADVIQYRTSVENGKPFDDKPLSLLELLTAVVAKTCKLSLADVNPPSKLIGYIVESAHGKPLDRVLTQIKAEFGAAASQLDSKTLSNQSVSELAQTINSNMNQPLTPGPVTAAWIDGLQSKLPSQFNLAKLKEYLAKNKMQSRSRIDSTLVHCALNEPSKPLTTEEQVKNWVAESIQARSASERGLVVDNTPLRTVDVLRVLAADHLKKHPLDIPDKVSIKSLGTAEQVESLVTKVVAELGSVPPDVKVGELSIAKLSDWSQKSEKSNKSLGPISNKLVDAVLQRKAPSTFGSDQIQDHLMMEKFLGKGQRDATLLQAILHEPTLLKDESDVIRWLDKLNAERIALSKGIKADDSALTPLEVMKALVGKQLDIEPTSVVSTSSLKDLIQQAGSEAGSSGPILDELFDRFQQEFGRLPSQISKESAASSPLNQLAAHYQDSYKELGPVAQQLIDELASESLPLEFELPDIRNYLEETKMMNQGAVDSTLIHCTLAQPRTPLESPDAVKSWLNDVVTLRALMKADKPVDNTPLSALLAARAIVAKGLGLSVNQVKPTDSVKSCAERELRSDQGGADSAASSIKKVLSQLRSEFGPQVMSNIDGVLEAVKLIELAEAVQPTYSTLGSTFLTAADQLNHKLPEQFDVNRLKHELAVNHSLGKPMVDSTLIQAVLQEPISKLQEEAVQPWIQKLIQRRIADEQGLVVDDTPLTAKEVLTVILSKTLKKDSPQINFDLNLMESIVAAEMTMVDGMDVLIPLIEGEFGLPAGLSASSIGGIPLNGLVAHYASYCALGPISTEWINKLAKSCFPPTFSLTDAKKYLAYERMLGPGRVESILIQGVLKEPKEALASDSDVKQWLDKMIQDHLAAQKGVTVTPEPLAPFDTMRVLMANELKIEPVNIQKEISIQSGVALVAGLPGSELNKFKSSDEIFKQFNNEFGPLPPTVAKPFETTLGDLTAVYEPTYKTLGPQAVKLLNEIIQSKLPSNVTLNTLRSKLLFDRLMSSGLTDGILLQAILHEPAARLKSDNDVDAWIDELIQFRSAMLKGKILDVRPFTMQEALKAILAKRLLKRPHDIVSNAAINKLILGSASSLLAAGINLAKLVDDIFADIQHEIGPLPLPHTVASASDMSVDQLLEVYKNIRYTALGPVSQEWVQNLVHAKLPEDMSLADIQQYLGDEMSLGQGRIDSTLLQSVFNEPKEKLTNREAVEQWLSDVLTTAGGGRRKSLSKQGTGSLMLPGQAGSQSGGNRRRSSIMGGIAEGAERRTSASGENMFVYKRVPLDRVKFLFDWYDTDGSGTVNLGELVDSEIFSHLSEEQLEDIFKQYDDDGSDELEFDEFLKLANQVGLSEH